MTDVFVIHGVSNRVKETFAATVQRLAERSTGLNLVPVFWGDLGAANENLDLVIPSPMDLDDVRSPSEPSLDKPHAEIVEALLGAADVGRETETRDGVADPAARRDIIAERAGQGTDGLSRDQWRTVLEETWAELPYLSAIGDAEVLARLGEGLATSDHSAPAAVEDVRGPVDWAKQRLSDMETAASAVVGAAAGRVNHLLRTQIGPNFAQFAGDIAVYQRRQAAIHNRVRETLEPYGAGTRDNPAHIVAHSLGGVIVMDMAIDRDNPLHIDGLVTFGSQWPLFQLIDPRDGVDKFVNTPVSLPATFQGRWLNLWEPLDPLAFAAAHTLKMRAGSAPNPDDRQARYRTSSGLWTHSSYWTSQELLVAMQDAFTHDAR